MGGALVCDGCGGDLDRERARTVGKLRPCVYCEDCSAKWTEFVREAESRRGHPAEEFEAWREAELQILGTHWLRKLPDE